MGKNRKGKKNQNQNKNSDEDLDEILAEFKAIDEKNKYDLVCMGKWTSAIGNIEIPSRNHMLRYDRTLNPINMSHDLSVPARIYDMRRAAEVHRQVRRHIQSIVQPGMLYSDICSEVEDTIVKLCGKNNLEEGIGFPTGLSVNNVAAHDSANPDDSRRIQYNDVIKIDYGTHRNGNIIDSAFTVAFNPRYKPLLDATKAATWEGIRLAGPDARVNELSEVIKETIESYEVNIDGKIYPVRAVTNLGGHNIEPYRIHAGKLVLGGPTEHVGDMKMEAGECYAIETFATTGKNGLVVNSGSLDCNHYALNYDRDHQNFALATTRKLYSHINKTRSSLPFCTRWLERDFGKGWKLGLKELVGKNVVTAYPPLVDAAGTYTSQWEHTIFLHDYGKEVLSYGDDY